MLLLKKAKPKTNNKTKAKKQATFTSSECSLPVDRNQSISQLFRNDLLKRKTQAKTNKSQKQLCMAKKRTKSKRKLRLDKCQTYEIIPYKNSMNSQIIFSNEETKRQGSMDDSVSGQLAIRVNQQYLVDTNRQLRISIKKEYQKKVQAAIKIQKVFRGHLTRRILQKYVQQQQKNLSQRLISHESQSISQHSSYFAEKEANQPKKRVRSQNQGIFQFLDLPENDEESSEQELNRAIYRHHEPIYSQHELSGYLSSSQQQDFDQDAFNNHIIFETNQQYIDSRKSSNQQQQPRNKLSHSRPPSSVVEALPEAPKNQITLHQSDLIKTQKKPENKIKMKIQDQQIKEETIKLSQQADKTTMPLPAFLQEIEYAATLKQEECSMKKKGGQGKQIEAVQISRLKENELQRWQQIIGFVESHLRKPSIGTLEVADFMQKIMEMSIKNKKLLELEPIIEPNNDQILMRNSLKKIDSRSKLKSIKANRHYLSHNGFQEDSNLEITQKLHLFEDIKEKQHQKNVNIDTEKKKENLVLLQKKMFDKQAAQKMDKIQQKKLYAATLNLHSSLSVFANASQMKKYLSANIQDENIDEMLRLRQVLLKKREEEQIKKLNLQMERQFISPQGFRQNLQKIQVKYEAEKACIDKAKQDISKGFKAAMKLKKQTINDANKLGYKLPISRSLESLKSKVPLIYSDIIIDEMVNIKAQDRIQKSKEVKNQKLVQPMLGSESDHQSSDEQFTEEELSRFRRAQPYDIRLAGEIAEMGRNMMISQEMFRQQQLDEEHNDLMKTQHVCKQVYEIQEASPPPKNDPTIELIAEKIFQSVIFEASGDLFVKPLFSQKLISKGHFYKPTPVSDKERMKFIECLQKNFSSIEQLNCKLNQKICPLPSELLRCMRIDFSQQDDDDQNSYQQIGKYQFIIGQDICNLAIISFKKLFQEKTPYSSSNLQQIQHFSKEFNPNQKVLKCLQQRQKHIANRRNHTKELRWQVLNIQLHCIFDAWNEQLIFLRSQKAGYSGIGLNELTLSVKDHNCLVALDQTLSLVKEGKKRLIHSLSITSPSLIFPLVNEDQDAQQLEADSRWIFYADQALSYGLELAYLIEEEMFSQMAKEIRKRMLIFC